MNSQPSQEAGFTQPRARLIAHLCKGTMLCTLDLVPASAVTAVETHDAVVEVAEGVQAELRAVRAARRDGAEAGVEGVSARFEI